MHLKTRLLLVTAAVAVAAPLATAGSAHAGVLVNDESAANCQTQVLEQPFRRWLDYFHYTLVPGGDFEPGSQGWSLAQAKVVQGNEPYYVRSPRDQRSLSLGSAGSAVSGAMCVSIEYPTLRLFARNRGSATSQLAVEVLYEDASGAVQSLPIGKLSGTASWQPTLPVPIVANLLAAFPGERTAIAFRFEAVGSGGDWQIDDVFVDPHRRS